LYIVTDARRVPTKDGVGAPKSVRFAGLLNYMAESARLAVDARCRFCEGPAPRRSVADISRFDDPPPRRAGDSQDRQRERHGRNA
jgi:hypothetical protein